MKVHKSGGVAGAARLLQSRFCASKRFLIVSCFLCALVAPVLAQRAVSVSAGGQSSCACESTGTCVCWGATPYNGYTQAKIGYDEVPCRVVGSLPLGGPATNMSQSSSVTCVRVGRADADGYALCWGDRSALGLVSDDSQLYNTAETALKIANVKHVGAGETHVCVVEGETPGGRTADCVRCFGDNSQGQIKRWAAQLGNASASSVVNTDTASCLAPGGRITGLAVGYTHVCVIADGAVRCYGDGSNGQLGDGSEARTDKGKDPSQVNFGNSVVIQQLAAGHFHTCALSTEGKLWCWGAGRDGALGYGDNENIGASVGKQVEEESVLATGGSRRIGWACAWGSYTCAVTDSGMVTCWGNAPNNNMFQTGNSAEAAMSLLHADVEIVAQQVACGTNHLCVLGSYRSDRETLQIWCWGQDPMRAGSLGRGRKESDVRPTSDKIQGGENCVFQPSSSPIATSTGAASMTATQSTSASVEMSRSNSASATRSPVSRTPPASLVASASVTSSVGVAASAGASSASSATAASTLSSLATPSGSYSSSTSTQASGTSTASTSALMSATPTATATRSQSTASSGTASLSSSTSVTPSATPTSTASLSSSTSVAPSATPTSTASLSSSSSVTPSATCTASASVVGSTLATVSASTSVTSSVYSTASASRSAAASLSTSATVSGMASTIAAVPPSASLTASSAVSSTSPASMTASSTPSGSPVRSATGADSATPSIAATSSTLQTISITATRSSSGATTATRSSTASPIDTTSSSTASLPSTGSHAASRTAFTSSMSSESSSPGSASAGATSSASSSPSRMPASMSGSASIHASTSAATPSRSATPTMTPSTTSAGGVSSTSSNTTLTSSSPSSLTSPATSMQMSLTTTASETNSATLTYPQTAASASSSLSPRSIDDSSASASRSITENRVFISASSSALAASASTLASVAAVASLSTSSTASASAVSMAASSSVSAVSRAASGGAKASAESMSPQRSRVLPSASTSAPVPASSTPATGDASSALHTASTTASPSHQTPVPIVVLRSEKALRRRPMDPAAAPSAFRDNTPVAWQCFEHWVIAVVAQRLATGGTADASPRALRSDAMHAQCAAADGELRALLQVAGVIGGPQASTAPAAQRRRLQAPAPAPCTSACDDAATPPPNSDPAAVAFSTRLDLPEHFAAAAAAAMDTWQCASPFVPGQPAPATCSSAAGRDVLSLTGALALQAGLEITVRPPRCGSTLCAMGVARAFTQAQAPLGVDPLIPAAAGASAFVVACTALVAWRYRRFRKTVANERISRLASARAARDQGGGNDAAAAVPTEVSQAAAEITTAVLELLDALEASAPEPELLEVMDVDVVAGDALSGSSLAERATASGAAASTTAAVARHTSTAPSAVQQQRIGMLKAKRAVDVCSDPKMKLIMRKFSNRFPPAVLEALVTATVQTVLTTIEADDAAAGATLDVEPTSDDGPGDVEQRHTVDEQLLHAAVNSVMRSTSSRRIQHEGTAADVSLHSDAAFASAAHGFAAELASMLAAQADTGEPGATELAADDMQAGDTGATAITAARSDGRAPLTTRHIGTAAGPRGRVRAPVVHTGITPASATRSADDPRVRGLLARFSRQLPASTMEAVADAASRAAAGEDQISSERIRDVALAAMQPAIEASVGTSLAAAASHAPADTALSAAAHTFAAQLAEIIAAPASSISESGEELTMADVQDGDTGATAIVAGRSVSADTIVSGKVGFAADSRSTAQSVVTLSRGSMLWARRTAELSRNPRIQGLIERYSQHLPTETLQALIGVAAGAVIEEVRVDAGSQAQLEAGQRSASAHKLPLRGAGEPSVGSGDHILSRSFRHPLQKTPSVRQRGGPLKVQHAIALQRRNQRSLQDVVSLTLMDAVRFEPSGTNIAGTSLAAPISMASPLVKARSVRALVAPSSGSTTSLTDRMQQAMLAKQKEVLASADAQQPRSMHTHSTVLRTPAASFAAFLARDIRRLCELTHGEATAVVPVHKPTVRLLLKQSFHNADDIAAAVEPSTSDRPARRTARLAESAALAQGLVRQQSMRRAPSTATTITPIRLHATGGHQPKLRGRMQPATPRGAGRSVSTASTIPPTLGPFHRVLTSTPALQPLQDAPAVAMLNPIASSRNLLKLASSEDITLARAETTAEERVRIASPIRWCA